ncbi:MAG: hypothetical protein QG640_685 [Patescibacteria group bacterium]|nr:hypothetical protein [Patescibacteria group bacterium]
MNKWLYVVLHLIIFSVIISAWNFFVGFVAMGVGDINPPSVFVNIIFFAHAYLICFIGASLSSGIITLWSNLNKEQTHAVWLRSSILIMVFFLLNFVPIYIPFISEIFMFGGIKQMLVQFAGFIFGTWLFMRPRNKVVNLS